MAGLSYDSLSPAGQIFAAGDYGGGLLQRQSQDETEEMRKKRMQEVQAGRLSPAGAELSRMGVLG